MKTKLLSILLTSVLIAVVYLLLFNKNKVSKKAVKTKAATSLTQSKSGNKDFSHSADKSGINRSKTLLANNIRLRIKPEPSEKKSHEIEIEKKDKSEKENLFREEEEKKFDHPDKFVQYENQIRTQYGAKKPAYPMNYKMSELNKAIQRRFGINLNSFDKSYKKLQGTSLPWVERGPGNISGRTRGMIVDPDDATGNTWFAASVSGGVWKTTDEGVNWTDLTPNLPNLATTVLAMAPSNHDVIYLGTGEGFYNADEVDGNGIFKSMDHGNTWSQLSFTVNNYDFQNVNRIIVSPTNANVLYACTNIGFNSFGLGTSGIFESTDGGNSWDNIYTSNSRIQQIVANPENFNTLFATVNGYGVIKSVNGGQTWDSTQGIITSGRVEIAIAPSDTSRLYAGVESSSGSDLYISNDAGNTWTLVNDVSGSNPGWLGTQGWYDNVLAVNPYYEDSLIVGGINLYKFAMVAGTDTVHDITASTTNTNSFFSFVNWGGSLLSGGAGTGHEFLGDTAVTDTDYVSVEIRFGPGISQKAHRFIRNPYTGAYDYQDYVTVPFQAWDITHNRQLMVSFRDNDSSGVFKLIQYNPQNLQREYMFISSITYDPNNPSSAIARDNGMIFKNIYAIWPILPTGASWNPNSLPTSKISILYKTIYAQLHSSTQITNWYSGAGYPYIHADQHNLIIIPVDQATDKYRVLNANDGGCAISNDGGNNWKQITSYQTTQFYGADKNPSEDQYLGGMQDNGTWFSGVNPNANSAYSQALGGDGFDVDWKYDNPKMMMGSVYNDAFYKSTDGGSTWNSATDGLADVGNNAPFITCLGKTNQDPDLIFSTGASGVWRSDNFGESWTLAPLPKSTYNSLRSIVSVSLANPQIVWAGGYLDSADSLYVSVDGGLTFHATNPNIIGKAYEVTGIATDPIHDSTAYILFSASQSPKILKTTNLGKTWNDISGFGSGTSSINGFPDVAVYSLLVMPTNPDTIWAGTDIGLFQSTNGGTSWQIANNGLPAVSIWSMKIVGDQVVVATHGRGIWSVNLPSLSGYTLPAATKSPRVNFLAQGPSGMLAVSLSLRSPYDSTRVLINGSSQYGLGTNNSAKDSVIYLPVTKAGTDSIQIVSFKSGITYKSSLAMQDVVVLQTARASYMNNFNTATTDFMADGFTIGTQTGFDAGSINSQHPYSDNTNNICELLVPITVASKDATLSYDDVAIVEPGDKGSNFGDSNFYDYVVVEGSTDGFNWVPLAPGYDCRANSNWLNAWNSNSTGDSSMFVHHDLNLLNTFTAGQKILVRFRLFADEYTHGWGWTIDNLSIQPKATGVAKDKNAIPKNFELSQNYPNPFNPSTVINFQLPVSERVTLIIYNSLGQKVKTLIDDYKDAGYYNIKWNGRNDFHESVASGVYFYRIQAGKFVQSKKMVLLK